jgi:hypothetical protein
MIEDYLLNYYQSILFKNIDYVVKENYYLKQINEGFIYYSLYMIDFRILLLKIDNIDK